MCHRGSMERENGSEREYVCHRAGMKREIDSGRGKRVSKKCYGSLNQYSPERMKSSVIYPEIKAIKKSNRLKIPPPIL